MVALYRQWQYKVSGSLVMCNLLPISQNMRRLSVCLLGLHIVVEKRFWYTPCELCGTEYIVPCTLCDFMCIIMLKDLVVYLRTCLDELLW